MSLLPKLFLSSPFVFFLSLTSTPLFVLSGCSSKPSETAEEAGGEADAKEEDELNANIEEGDAKIPSKSKKTGNAEDEPEADGANPESGLGEEAASADPSAAVGVLGFIGPGQGLAVTAIKWDQPIGQDNPGADCELRVAKKPGVYTCVVRKGANVAILNITEVGQGAGKRISKITMDGKGGATWRRWLKELKDNGYAAPKGPRKKSFGRSVWISSDGVTRADVIWVPKAKAVTVILKAAKGF